MSDELDLAAIRNMAGRVKDRHGHPDGDRSAYLLAIHTGKLLDRIAEMEAYPPMLIDPAAEQRGYDKAMADAAARIRAQSADIAQGASARAGVSISAAEEHPFVLGMEYAAASLEALKETPDDV